MRKASLPGMTPGGLFYGIYYSKGAGFGYSATGSKQGEDIPMSDNQQSAPATGQAGVMNVIARRTSCRAYKPDLVPDDLVRKILEAARLAPSACNKQPWRFAVVRDEAVRRRIVEDGFLPGIKMPWAIDAPVHVVIGMEREFTTHKLATLFSGVDYPWVDIGIAGEHLVLAAAELGLGTCWIGWIKPKALAKIVGWPRSIKPAVVITVGWPDEEKAGLPPVMRRKPLDEMTKWI